MLSGGERSIVASSAFRPGAGPLLLFVFLWIPCSPVKKDSARSSPPLDEQCPVRNATLQMALGDHWIASEPTGLTAHATSVRNGASWANGKWRPAPDLALWANRESPGTGSLGRLWCALRISPPPGRHPRQEIWRALPLARQGIVALWGVLFLTGPESWLHCVMSPGEDRSGGKG